MATTSKWRGGPDTIPAAYQDLVAWAKRAKDIKVDDAGPDENGDIEPKVAFYRGDTLVAQGFALHVNRDEGLDLAGLGTKVYSADRIEVLLDAHMTDQSFFNKYGRMPDPHELQNLCDNEGACDLGLTTDCIMAASVERRDGKAHLVVINLPYHVDRRTEVLPAKVAKAIKGDERDHIKREGSTYTRVTRTCHWQDDKIVVMDDAADRLGMSGTVPDVLRAIMEQETLRDVMAKEGVTDESLGLTAHEVHLHQDIAGTRVLAQLGFPVALVATGEADLDVIKASMARSHRVSMVDLQTGETITEPSGDEPIDMIDIMDAIGDVALERQRQAMIKAREDRQADEMAERDRRRAERALKADLENLHARLDDA